MDLPVRPPLPPMLAQLARALPTDGYVYEPKWDGFRCVAFRDGDEVDLRSRHGRPFSRYFPELVEAVLGLPAKRVVLDGEIVVVTKAGFDFPALMLRLHPSASRVARLRRDTPAQLIVFDVLALGDDDLRARPFIERRRILEDVLRGARLPLHLTPATDDEAVARRWLAEFEGGGIDGVVAKRRDLRYEPGRRAMVKVKHERTADCVVAGMRVFDDGRVSSLILGLYDGPDLRHVGVVSSLTDRVRREMLDTLSPLTTSLEGHPWEHGFAIEGSPVGRLGGSAGRWMPGLEQDWIPLRPERVCEVAYDRVDARRFRHPARFIRWRPDREARSCTFDQLDIADPARIEGLLDAG